MKRKLMLKLFAGFIVAFFAALGIKIKAKRARRAVKVAEKFFKKINKLNTRSKRFGKVSRTQSKFRPMFRDLTWDGRVKVKRMLRTNKAYRRLCRAAIRNGDVREIFKLQVCATRSPGKKWRESLWTKRGLDAPVSNAA